MLGRGKGCGMEGGSGRGCGKEGGGMGGGTSDRAAPYPRGGGKGGKGKGAQLDQQHRLLAARARAFGAKCALFADQVRSYAESELAAGEGGPQSDVLADLAERTGNAGCAALERARLWLAAADAVERVDL